MCVCVCVCVCVCAIHSYSWHIPVKEGELEIVEELHCDSDASAAGRRKKIIYAFHNQEISYLK